MLLPRRSLGPAGYMACGGEVSLRVPEAAERAEPGDIGPLRASDSHDAQPARVLSS
jgi:hypothetical protein